MENLFIAFAVTGILLAIPVLMAVVLYYSVVVFVGILYLLSGKRKNLLSRKQRFVRGMKLFIEKYHI